MSRDNWISISMDTFGGRSVNGYLFEGSIEVNDRAPTIFTFSDGRDDITLSIEKLSVIDNLIDVAQQVRATLLERQAEIDLAYKDELIATLSERVEKLESKEATDEED